MKLGKWKISTSEYIFYPIDLFLCLLNNDCYTDKGFGDFFNSDNSEILTELFSLRLDVPEI